MKTTNVLLEKYTKILKCTARHSCSEIRITSVMLVTDASMIMYVMQCTTYKMATHAMNRCKHLEKKN